MRESGKRWMWDNDQNRCANIASLDYWRELRSKYKLPSSSRIPPVLVKQSKAKLGTGKG
ncbi:uncharacterized protein BO88DRAFT_477707, partial [Aspergillus vadensis CBS 113365]